MSKSKVVSIRIKEDDFVKITKLSKIPPASLLKCLIKYFIDMEDDIKNEVIKNALIKNS